MIKINFSYLYKFKQYSYGYMYKVINGVYLRFNNNFEYVGLDTFYNISNKSYIRLEEDALNTLLKLGWISYE